MALQVLSSGLGSVEKAAPEAPGLAPSLGLKDDGTREIRGTE